MTTLVSWQNFLLIEKIFFLFSLTYCSKLYKSMKMDKNRESIEKHMTEDEDLSSLDYSDWP